MASFYFLMVVVFLAATLTTAEDCAESLTKCASKPAGSSKEEICKTARATIECTSNALKNESTCTSDQKVQLQKLSDTSQKVLSMGCSGSSLMSSLLLCLGLSSVTYLLTALK